MNEKVKFTPLNKEDWEQAYLEAWERVDECYRNDPIALFDEIVSEEQELEWTREVIEKSHQESGNENDHHS